MPSPQLSGALQGPNVDLEAFPESLQKDCLLFHYPETEALARKICAASASRVELGEIKWACAPTLLVVALAGFGLLCMSRGL